MRSVRDLIIFGSAWEDDRAHIRQSLKHFYNPINGRGLYFGNVTVGIPSPNWTLEAGGETFQGASPPQQFSYRLARKHFLDALTKSAKSERNENWGLTFQTVGHIVHHMQDMAQPQHTRNDQHCDIAPCELTGALGGVKPSYEKWTDIVGNTDDVQRQGYDPVYVSTGEKKFAKPFEFWKHPATGVGIAEYSNRNFFTSGANVDSTEFLLPVVLPGEVFKTPIGVLCAEQLARGRSPCSGLSAGVLFGSMGFYRTLAVDNLRPDQTTANPRATTKSIYNEDLRLRGLLGTSGAIGLAGYSVNRFTYESQNNFVLKRAVAYSAGMINYFFRGDIDFIEDLAEPGTYKIRNDGPDAIKGRFQLCYDHGTTGNETRTCFKSWDNLEIAAGGAVSAGTFQIPTSPAPLKPNEYMLVFNGDMGEEKAADFDGIGAVTARKVTLKPPQMFYLFRTDGPPDHPSGTIDIGLFGNEALWSAMAVHPQGFSAAITSGGVRRSIPMDRGGTGQFATCAHSPNDRVIPECAYRGGTVQVGLTGAGWLLRLHRGNQFILTTDVTGHDLIMIGANPEDLGLRPIETVCGGRFVYSSALYLTYPRTTGPVKFELFYAKDAMTEPRPVFSFTVGDMDIAPGQNFGAKIRELQGVERTPIHCGVNIEP
ncbi:MAG: hypothetical protein JNK75_09790 [Betaproteobacteria bacterium]|nr:hypothetical protein [Betaproteobacteria bacterium]